MEARKEMIGVDKIDDIRKLGRSGASVASIARDTGVSEPTVRGYLREADLSERPPRVGRTPTSPLLEPHAASIDAWPGEDRRCWRKQRHTARRVYDRLVAERGYGGSCSTVRRYVKRRGRRWRPGSTPARRRASCCPAGCPGALGRLRAGRLPGARHDPRRASACVRRLRAAAGGG